MPREAEQHANWHAVLLYRKLRNRVPLNWNWCTILAEFASNNIEIENDHQKRRKITTTDVIVFLISILSCIFLGGYLLLHNAFPKVIVLLFMVMPTLLLFIINCIKASGPIKDIIFGKYSNQDLSIKEKISFDIIIGSCSFLFTSVFSNKIIAFIIGLPINRIIIEFLMSLFIMIFAFVISFFAIEELILPIKHIHKVIVFISKRIGKMVNEKIDQFLVYREEDIIKANFSNRFIAFSARYRIVLRVLLSILVIPYTLLLDIIVGAFLCFIYYLLGAVIVVFVEFFRFLGKGIIYLVNYFSCIPERLVIKNTFRFSFILSVTVMVVLNRFSVICKYDDAYLSVSEFVASAIVIPVIFEWIYSSGKNESSISEKSKAQLQASSSNIEINNNKKKCFKRKKHKYRRKK